MRRSARVYDNGIEDYLWKIIVLCFISLLFLCFWTCAEWFKGGQLRGAGLFREKERLVWSLTVGVLEDSEFEAARQSSLQSALKQSAKEISRLLPGIRIKYVTDQPLNAVFMMQRSLSRKKGDVGLVRFSEQSPILFLHEFPNTPRINAQKLKVAGLSQRQSRAELRFLQVLKKAHGPRGKPLLSEKLTLSDFIWRSYLRQQVRYDLVLTNALVYPDDLSSRTELVRAKSGVLRWRLTEMPGRAGMEGYGAYVSYGAWEKENGLYRHLQAQELSSAIYAALLALVFPLNAEALGSYGQRLHFQKLLRRSLLWKAYWRQRLSYLQALADLHRGKEGACKTLSKTFIEYDRSLPGPLRGATFYFPAPESKHRRVLRTNHQRYLRHCRKKLL